MSCPMRNSALTRSSSIWPCSACRIRAAGSMRPSTRSPGEPRRSGTNWNGAIRNRPKPVTPEIRRSARKRTRGLGHRRQAARAAPGATAAPRSLWFAHPRPTCAASSCSDHPYLRTRRNRDEATEGLSGRGQGSDGRGGPGRPVSPPMVVWRIEGGAHDGRNGGPMLVYAVTRSESELPDPDLALRIAHPQHEWSRIDNVTRAGEIPPAWGTGGAFDHLILFLARQDQSPTISPSPAPEEEE